MRHAASAAGEYKCLLLDCVEACTGSHSAELLREAVLVSSLGTALVFKQAVAHAFASQ